MKYFAFLDENDVVTQVLPVPDAASESDFAARLGMTCKETFRDETTRGKYAGPGYSYHESDDIFVGPKPYASWVLNTSAADWEPPVAAPTDGRSYFWNEATTSWQAAESDELDSANLSDADMEVLRNVASDDSYNDVLSRLSAEGRAWVEGSR